MIPHPCFSLMVVWALLWLFCMLPVAWPSQGGGDTPEARRARAYQTPTHPFQRTSTVCGPDSQASVCAVCTRGLTSQTVPSPPLLWWGVRATLPCKPQTNEETRRENAKTAVRALHVRA